MKRLVVVRHGQTTWNAEGRIQGQSDSPLSELGREQAARMARVVAGYQPVAIWSSDLSRAALTADAIAAATGLAPVRDARLREVDFGALEGLSHGEYRAVHPDRYEALRRGRYDEIPDAERSAAVQARMTAVLHELFDGIEDGRTAVAVSHGGAIKLGVGGLLGLSADASVELLWGMDNCGWAIVTDSAGERRLHAYNRTA